MCFMGDKGSILAVDDTTDSLRVLTNILKAEGYRVQPADSGELALASLAGNPPDLILLDVRMPGLDGFETCRRIKAQKCCANIPVIFLSALSEVEDRVEGLKLGAVDFISKPVQKEELLARVETHLELARLRTVLEERVAERTAELRVANEQLQAEVAQHKLTLRALRESQERVLASQKLESLAVLAQGIAHDVGNLLGTVLGEADLAQSDLPPDSPARENLARIRTVVLRESEIISLLKAYVGGGKDVPVEPLNVSDLVAETVQLLRSSVSKKAVIQTNPAPGLPAIWANATQVRQLVMNLLTNASEALGDRPGSITFTTTHVIPADGDSIKKGHVLLEVSDTGCGIREEIQHKVFDPFFTTKAQGRGLGLSAVYGIARGFGGSVRVRSVPGQGSTFEVLFPCSRKEP